MLEKILLKMGNIILGEVTKDGDTFSFIRNEEVKDSWLFPYDFYHLEDNELTNEVSSKQIEAFFRGRGVPENREGIYAVLRYYGLNTYNYWELAKKTQSRDIDDNFYIEVIK